MENLKATFASSTPATLKEEPTVDLNKLEESIDNMQEQLKMLEKSKAKITERLIKYQGLYYSLSHLIK